MSASETPNGDTGKSAPVDPDIARDLVKHENDLVNQRLTWFITIQGLLFAALGFAWGTPDARPLIFVFCGLGMLTAVSSAFALWGAAAAIEGLCNESGVVSQSVIGRQAGIAKFAYPWYTFPVLFGLAWGAVLLINWKGPA
jgi:hypothetical protein